MRRRPRTATLSLFCCLNHLSSASPPSLISFSIRSVQTLMILFQFLQIVWVVEFTTPNFRHSLPHFLFWVSRSTWTFSSTLKTLLLFMTVAMFSLYTSSDNCKRRNAEDNFMHDEGYRYCCHFPDQEVIWLPETVDGLSFQRRREERIRRIFCILENYVGTDDWHYNRGRCSWICRTKQGRRTHALWYHKMRNVIDEVSHKPSSL
jgi:hypothetical protein